MFDFTPPTEPDVVRDLRAARALMEPGYAKYQRRLETAEGVRFCIGGAIDAAIGGRLDDWHTPRFKLAAEAINRAVDRTGLFKPDATAVPQYRFARFNNHPLTTHADILKVFDDAITATLNDGVGGPLPAREACYA